MIVSNYLVIYKRKLSNETGYIVDKDKFMAGKYLRY